MARYILGLFLFVTIIILVFSFIKGVIRRLLGIPITENKMKNNNNPVLYEKDGIVVLKGEQEEKK